jgi:hypothetical protein
LGDRHGGGRGGGVVGLGEGAFESVEAEASAALDAAFGDTVGDEDESLAGLELALGGPEGRFAVTRAQWGWAGCSSSWMSPSVSTR